MATVARRPPTLGRRSKTRSWLAARVVVVV
uniref:Uncharacterized protein n=1 Tax=Arundo donax TaxID=35708 RepID=A0A0A9ESS4_ARUDO